ncbi:MAG: prolipoprotein diacylglyceryl transferase [Bacteroidales bacterium]|nr:prolipoprotein diacylglyceryl transferase [Bacteroidales bacterium]
MVIPLAGVFFRWGNLMNSEIYGEPTSLPWGFIFESSPEVLRGREEAVPRHPTQIYEMICYFSLFVVYMLHCWKRLRNGEPISDSFIIGMFGVWVFGGRFLIEFLKMPQVAFEQGLPLNMGQILSLPFIIWGGIALGKMQMSKSQRS